MFCLPLVRIRPMLPTPDYLNILIIRRTSGLNLGASYKAVILTDIGEHLRENYFREDKGTDR